MLLVLLFLSISIIGGDYICYYCTYESPSSSGVLKHEVDNHSVVSVAELLSKGGGGEGVRPPHAAPLQGRQFRPECISTTPIGAPIYIWPRAAVPPAPPLCSVEKSYSVTVISASRYRNR